MNAPKMLDPDEFLAAVRRWLAAHARQINAAQSAFVRRHKVDHAYLCNTCSDIIKARVCYISIHVAEFGTCSGPGQVDRVELPFCPKCEPDGKRSDYGCIHVPYDRIRALDLDLQERQS